MSRKRLDSSGAILFLETPEEREIRTLKEKVDELEKRLNSLEKLLIKGGILNDKTIEEMGTD